MIIAVTYIVSPLIKTEKYDHNEAICGVLAWRRQHHAFVVNSDNRARLH